MTPGEIYLTLFPFGGKVGRKPRPALVLTSELGSVPEIVAAYMTSKPPPDPMLTDYPIAPAQPEFAATNLTAVTIVRLHKIATLHRRDFLRRMGELSPQAWVEIDLRLKLLFHH